MQWIADSIHDFTEADRQKSPSEELIVSWPVHRVAHVKKNLVTNHSMVGIKRDLVPSKNSNQLIGKI